MGELDRLGDWIVDFSEGLRERESEREGRIAEE